MNRDIVKEFSEHNVLELKLQYLMGRAAIDIREQGYISLFQTWEISQNTLGLVTTLRCDSWIF